MGAWTSRDRALANGRAGRPPPPGACAGPDRATARSGTASRRGCAADGRTRAAGGSERVDHEAADALGVGAARADLGAAGEADDVLALGRRLDRGDARDGDDGRAVDADEGGAIEGALEGGHGHLQEMAG